MSLTLGPFTIDTIQTGLFRLDGGAMFGVVPKTLWSQKIPADDLNRIPMGMRCWMVRSAATGRVYLVDTGAGDKGDDKFRSIYAMDDSAGTLNGGLASLGLTSADITDVILTHLHFDHGGGVTRFRPGTSEPELTFPTASHWVTADHLETAMHPNQREKASFLRDNVQPLFASDRLMTTEEGHVYEPGFDALWVHGHTLGMQLPRIRVGGTTLLFAADLFPTAAHIPLPWVMGYDMQPLRTLQEKEQILAQAAAEGWHIFLEHDADHEVVTVGFDGRGYKADRFLALDELG